MFIYFIKHWYRDIHIHNIAYSSHITSSTDSYYQYHMFISFHFKHRYSPSYQGTHHSVLWRRAARQSRSGSLVTCAHFIDVALGLSATPRTTSPPPPGCSLKSYPGLPPTMALPQLSTFTLFQPYPLPFPHPHLPYWSPISTHSSPQNTRCFSIFSNYFTDLHWMPAPNIKVTCVLLEHNHTDNVFHLNT